MKSRIKKTFGKLRWFLIMIAAGAALYLLTDIFLCPYTFDSDFILPSLTVEPDTIMDAAQDDDGYLALYSITDNGYFLSYINPDTGDQMLFDSELSIFTSSDYSNQVDQIAAGGNGTIYAVLLSYGKKSDYIAKESIVRLSSDDYEDYDVLFSISHEGDYVRTRKLTGLSCHDGTVTFSYVDYDKTVLYQIDAGTGMIRESHEYLPEDGTFIIAVRPAGDRYLMIRSDGNVYLTSFDEPLGESIMKIGQSLEDYDVNRLIRGCAVTGGDLYVYTSDSSVYKVEDGLLTEILDMDDYVGREDSKIVRMDSAGDQLMIAATGGIVRYSDGQAALVDIKEKTSAEYVITYFIELHSSLLMLFGCLGALIHLIVRQKTILYKQLITVIPIIAVLVVVIAYNLYSINVEQQKTMNASKLKEVTRLCLKELEGYDFSGLTAMDENTGKACTGAREKLLELESTDDLDSGYGYNLNLFADAAGGEKVPLVSTRVFTIPLTRQYDNYYFDEDFVMPSDGQVTVVMKDASILASDYLAEQYAVGKIEGTDIYLLVVLENYNILYSRLDAFFKTALSVVLIFAVVALIITLNAVYVTFGITKASKTIRKIASGDLSARADYKAKDELGEICGQVNRMAESLQNMFEEKDKTERFYYKFVPEKFRVFLGKDNFTDLKLGDAKSREITILFCDIRSFSINSEIMTAKENFEFINDVYGKAGPVVRENNGFIDKYIGDAIMALFDNADDAVRCGIELYRKIVLAEDSKIKIGVGIHSGMAMVGIVGESERLSGTVIADAVNLSSRLESLTKQYKTAMLVSKDTIDRLSDADIYDLRYLGIMQVAGVNEVKSVYEVLDCLPDDIRAERQSHSMELRDAIKNFHMGNRREAVEILTKIESNCDDDKDSVIKMYLEYIKNMSDEDKGNVFRFTRK